VEMRVAAFCAFAAGLGLVPTPVGQGPRYRPAPDGPARQRTQCTRAPLRAGARVHLELFANRRVVVVPAGIGVERPRLRLGRVVAASCRTRLWTLDPSGVVRYEGAATLADVFATWGRVLGPRRLLTFHGRVRAWVNGRPRTGDPRRLRLRDRDEVVLEVGGLVPPHRSFRFPP
jgi:hypothetical protein